jgi:hypothetical protein
MLCWYKQSAVVARVCSLPCSLPSPLSYRRLFLLFLNLCEYVADVVTRTTLGTSTVRSKDTESNYARPARLDLLGRSETNTASVAHTVATSIAKTTLSTDGVSRLDPGSVSVTTVTVLTLTTLSLTPKSQKSNNERSNLCDTNYSPLCAYYC